MEKELGFLSARYESSAKGSLAIGYDSTGGTSYGKYQIASKTGTMKQFLKFLRDTGKGRIADYLQNSGPANTGSTKGSFPNAWIKAVPDLGTAEHDFIETTLYAPAFRRVESDDLKFLINKYFVLQNVLWSTAVQHGASRGAGIFNQAWNDTKDISDFIQRVYDIRGTRFRSSTPKVQQAVRNRFASECKQALLCFKQQLDEMGIDIRFAEVISDSDTNYS